MPIKDNLSLTRGNRSRVRWSLTRGHVLGGGGGGRLLSDGVTVRNFDKRYQNSVL